MSETYTDDQLKRILTSCRRIAVVGMSVNPVRPSFYVGRYLALKGYQVFPVNPAHAGKEVFGRTVLSGLDQIEGGVDMVDIFRRPDHVGPIVDEALALLPDLKCVWMQIGVVNEAAAAKARAAGAEVIMDRCPKIEYQRLFGELRMGGFNTGVISSKL